jgi:hypothetical protein
MDEGRWSEAEAALERAADFAGASSDLSYLLALAHSHENRPKGMVLEALRRALATDRWNRYSPDEGRLWEAAVLIRLRAFSEALGSLALTGESPRAACLRLGCLKGLGDIPAFRRTMALTLDRYPRESRPVRILLEYLLERKNAGALPEGNEAELAALALRRLPLLVEADPALAYLAAPFVRDTVDARRLVASYRALGNPDPASIPGALDLGLIDEDQAMEELFFSPLPGNGPSRTGERTLDRSLILAVWGLLRNEASRDAFRRNLLSYSGVITDDEDWDGYAETRTRYAGGVILEYRYDADQDGREDLRVSFSAGIPLRAETWVVPGGPAGGAGVPGAALIQWETYPAVLRTELDGIAYIPRPGEFLFTPLRFAEFLAGGTASFLYPQRDDGWRALSRRSLAAFSLAIERPGGEFPGALEVVELDRGIPRRGVEYVEGRPAAITDFAAGQPLVQRIDLDLDGRMETIRRFRQDIPPAGEDGRPGPSVYGRALESSESDWDGDGVYETGEEYFPDGTIRRAWDLDEKGRRRVYRSGIDEG